MDLSSNWVQALVLALVWIGILFVLRVGLWRAFRHYERRLAERDPSVAARRRTTFSILLRVVIAVVVLIGGWVVLSTFPATEDIARAFLASGAVLAVVAGLALTTPLGNLGSGVMLAFSQPVRLGDRITVGDQTGVVDEITLSYTALQTDEGRRVFVPNRDMVSTTLVNNSVADPRRLVTVELPVRLNASMGAARRLTSVAVEGVESSELLDYDVRIGTLTEKTAWLTVVAYAPPGANVPRAASEIRERALAALGEAGLLPAAG
ncbi:MAG TPA: mechanosensitive ion channel domain-containing protein [Gaiellaceae bacterium]|jgi:small-conductance mechanosensitive channel|nr:mechanosensitive ion channel domain-containing protein [Gaiellaceae bacterium]